MMPCVFWKSGQRERTVTPEGTDLVLTTDIPHGERDVLVLDSLDVETWLGIFTHR